MRLCRGRRESGPIYATGTVSLNVQGELVAADAPAFLSFGKAALAFFSISRTPNRRFTSPEIVCASSSYRRANGAVTIRQAEIVVAGRRQRAARNDAQSGRCRLGRQAPDLAGTNQVRLPISAPHAPPNRNVEGEVVLATMVQVLVSRGEGSTGENPTGAVGDDLRVRERRGRRDHLRR